jgi:hypothetical protein
LRKGRAAAFFEKGVNPAGNGHCFVNAFLAFSKKAEKIVLCNQQPADG